jgi:amidase
MLRSSYRSAFVPHDIETPIYGAVSGPLAGLTAAVKDMFDMTGHVAGCGNPTWLATHQPATRNAGAVQAILDAGAAIIGKTICDEFFYSVTGANHHYGTPVNARAHGRMPGGSSSGSASAVGAGLCDFALGSDTGGSVRIPASFNGIYGLRPTHGRIDLSGVQEMAGSLDVPGWFAATPGVFRNVGAVLLDGRRASSAVQRVVIAEDTFEQADPAIRDLLRTLLEFMADDLPPFTHSHIAPDGFDSWREAMRIVQAYEVWQTYGEFVTRENPEFGPGVRERMMFAASVTGDAAADAAAIRAAAREHIKSIVTLGTVLALPTAPTIAPKNDTPAAELEDFRVRVMRLTCMASISGLPQVTIPAGTVDGCPVGLSFIGWEGGDEALLDLAYTLARHCGMAA